MSKIIPRYLYHITTKSNYEKIVSSRKLATRKEDFAGDAIFMFELQNFFKRWKGDKFNPESRKIIKDLMAFLKRDGSGFVLLRIPTKNLNLDLLRIRNVQKIFEEWRRLNTLHTKKCDEYNTNFANFFIPEYEKLKRKGYSGEELRQKEREIKNEYLQKQKRPTFQDIMTNFGIKLRTYGDSAKKRKLYQQRKEPIEYIYSEDIEIDKIKKIGECEADSSLFNIFSMLLKGVPEEKTLNLFPDKAK